MFFKRNNLLPAAMITARCLVWLLVGLTIAGALTFGYARHQGLTVLSVQTGSMRPLIRPGDAVLIRQTSSGAHIARGTIISYHSLKDPKVIITHRVIAYDVRTGRITTKGDALTEADPVFGSDRVVGRVERVVPVIGYDLDLMRRPIGLATAVYLPAFVLIGGEMQRLTRYYDSRYYRLAYYFA